MPFTLAHPAIILPLARSKRFSITALITGSIIPDLEFFLQLRETENIGHHGYGIILFNFPLALITCFLFHNLLKKPLVNNLPQYAKVRATGALNVDWNSYSKINKLSITLSLFTGIGSHITWDAFTHDDGFFVELLPLLSSKIDILNYRIPVYFLLQLVFSVAGLLAVLYSVHRLPQQQITEANKSNTSYWPLLLLFFTIIIFIRILAWPQHDSFWDIFMAVMGSICYSWILTSLFIKNPFQLIYL
jgi:hypothetical protein